MIQHYLLLFRSVGSGAAAVTPPTTALLSWDSIAPKHYFTAGERMNFDTLAATMLLDADAGLMNFDTIQPLPTWSE